MRRRKARAQNEHPGPREFYARVGLNDRELDILQVSVPKKHYYVISPQGGGWSISAWQSRAFLGGREWWRGEADW